MSGDFDVNNPWWTVTDAELRRAVVDYGTLYGGKYTLENIAFWAERMKVEAYNAYHTGRPSQDLYFRGLNMGKSSEEAWEYSLYGDPYSTAGQQSFDAPSKSENEYNAALKDLGVSINPITHRPVLATPVQKQKDEDPAKEKLVSGIIPTKEQAGEYGLIALVLGCIIVGWFLLMGKQRG